MSLYDKIRGKIYENQTAFKVIRFFFTPVRHTREYYNRRNMAETIITKYRGLTKNDHIVFYFGIPEHNNLGDMAQTFCTRKWIKDNYPSYKIVEIRTRASFDRKMINFIKGIVTEDDLFVFQSGYCTRDTNADHLMHVNIMSIFPEQRAVILPQTVLLKTKKEIERTRQIFNGTSKLLFIARDAISYEKAKEFVGLEKLRVYPDIVTSLIGSWSEEKSREGVLYCMRNDDEKYYSDDAIQKSMNDMRKVTGVVDITDTNSDWGVWETYDNFEQIIEEKIRSFSEYQAIITDRYHGTIFSLIANTPVIVVRTNDHKVSSGVDWFDGVYEKSSVVLADNLQDAQKKARYIIENNIRVNNSTYFMDHYYKTKLKTDLDNIN